MEMSANPFDVITYVGLTIGSVIVVVVSLTVLQNYWKTSGKSSGAVSSSVANTASSVANTASTIVSTTLIAAGAAGGAIGGHLVATEIVGVDPPPIIEKYLTEDVVLANENCTWSESILGTWYIDDISMTIDAESGDRQDLPTIVGGTMRFDEAGKMLFFFDRAQKFEIESENLRLNGTWACIEEDKIQLWVDLELDGLEAQFAEKSDMDTEEMLAEAEERFGVNLDMLKNLPTSLGFILVYSVHDHGIFLDHDVMELNLKTAGVDGSTVTFLEAIVASGILNSIPVEELTLEEDCVLTDVACWDKIVGKSAAYFAREIELSRRS